MHKSPRLLFLQGTSLLENYGGIEYYLDDLLTLSTDLGGHNSAAAIVPKRGKSPGNLERPYPVSVVPFSSSRWIQKYQNRLSPRFIWRALRQVQAFKPDALVCGHVSLGPLTHLVHRLTGLPYYSVVYGIESWGGLSAPNEWALRQAQGIISISHWTKKILVERGYPEDKIAIVHPSLAESYCNLPRPQRGPNTHSPFRLLTVSRLDAREQYKGQDHIIEALARLKKEEPDLAFRYTIQGDGTDRPRLERLVAQFDVQDRVEFRSGVTERGEFEEAYRACDLYVMPSRFGQWDGRWRGEGFGIVYLEAAALGVPSVAYDCGGATDIIQNEVTGVLVKPDDIWTLTETLSTLARNPARLHELGRNAYDHVMKNFSRSAIRAELKKALNQVKAS